MSFQGAIERRGSLTHDFCQLSEYV